MLSAALRKETQSLAACTLRCRARPCQDLARRALTSSAPSSSSISPSSSASPVSSSALPWFMDPSDDPALPSSYARRVGLAQAPTRPLPPLPADLPSDHPIVRLHAELKSSPHLEPGTLLVRSPIPTAVGPPLPESMPKGRRKRGRTYVGEGVAESMGGIWEWLVIAQVKEGTENRGAIESVIRVVRKALLTCDSPVPLPPNNKRRANGSWAMIDAGDFAVHILSREAREKYFPDRREFS
ncbi:hypothetical protein BD309DRAFT_952876 [Dichomitus squalens]|uniref:Uncharacterized protein n=1 Tax=Dichomitus squalens TaxID=114155 RepID=A0A4V6MWV2_9APHY|nr:hypothetical protein BD309DRAFT_952876 [Dichomitus squalens]TBU60698.1 hypothetical protein BD310DRAFT_922496 [Dichomitus squalens]